MRCKAEVLWDPMELERTFSGKLLSMSILVVNLFTW